MDGARIRGGIVGLEREERNRKVRRKIFEVGMLGVEKRTPRYMVREELQREKLREKARRRALDFEKSLEKGGGE